MDLNSKRYILLITALMFLTICHGQLRDSLFFKGIIMESDSLNALPYAKYEINDAEKFLTDNKGQFSFWAKKGDIVSFSYVGYKTVFFNVKDSLVQENFLLGVFLSRDTILLSEIVILPQISNSKAMLERLPLKDDNDATVANKNISDVHQLAREVNESEVEYDADMNQRLSLDAKSKSVEYNRQIGPDQTLDISNLKIKELIDRRKYKRR